MQCAANPRPYVRSRDRAEAAPVSESIISADTGASLSRARQKVWGPGRLRATRTRLSMPRYRKWLARRAGHHCRSQRQVVLEFPEGTGHHRSAGPSRRFRQTGSVLLMTAGGVNKKRARPAYSRTSSSVRLSSACDRIGFVRGIAEASRGWPPSVSDVTITTPHLSEYP